MIKPVTIVILPRDRFSELDVCINELYAHTDVSLFELLVLDLGYPSRHLDLAKKALQGKANYRIIEYKRIIPMEAMDRVRKHIESPYTVFMDNDSRALEGWLPPLIETKESTDAAVVFPVTLEQAGVDEGEDTRVHLFTTEFRVVDVENTPFLIEHKTFRRSLPTEVPKEITESQAFELHCVMFDTKILKSLELPHMTIREHLDIGLQLKSQDLKIYVDPRSQILFDNLGTRANLSDFKYFNLRWNDKITSQSSRLFEKRWGYNFYSEEAIYNWAVRRRIFMMLRLVYCPIGIANKIDRFISALRRRLRPVWDPLDDPNGQSRPFFDDLNGNAPVQLDHSVR